ncbi:hypothetical protein [Streptomyces anulatus]|uniref:hypothetical protein n=1 Tax=Streptomyces anulatus TaxID=1892 RepID=UPI001C27E355|nr:hypothetical protein [Streptomyces anulatus]
MSRRPHPSLLPATTKQIVPRSPLDLGVHVQRVQVEELVVTDPALVLAHAHAAARHDPETAALLGYRPATGLTLRTAAALLCALHAIDDLTDMGLRAARHTTRITAASPHRESVVMELTDAPEQDG